VDETVRVVVFNATVSPKTPELDQLLVVPANGTNTVDFTFPRTPPVPFDYEVEIRTTSPFVVPYVTGLDAGLVALVAQTFTYGDLGPVLASKQGRWPYSFVEKEPGASIPFGNRSAFSPIQAATQGLSGFGGSSSVFSIAF